MRTCASEVAAGGRSGVGGRGEGVRGTARAEMGALTRDGVLVGEVSRSVVDSGIVVLVAGPAGLLLDGETRVSRLEYSHHVLELVHDGGC